MKLWRFAPIREIFLGSRNQNVFLFGMVLLPNFLAALMEGLSFTSILLALTVLSEGLQVNFGNYPFLSGSTISGWLATFSLQETFTLFIILAIVLQVIRSGLNYIGQLASTLLSTRMQIEAQKKVYEQILRLSFSCVSRYKVGDLIEYAKTPAILIHLIMNTLNNAIVASLAIVASIGVMLLLSIPLTILAVVVFGLLALSQKLVIRRISAISLSLSEHMVDFSKHTVQSLHGLRAIHTFDRQSNVMQRILSTLDQIALATKKLNLWQHSIPPVNEIMGIVLVGSFLVLGQWLMKEQQIAVLPILLTFITIVYRLNNRVQVLLGSAAAIAGNWGHVLRLGEILEDQDKEFTPSGGKLFTGLKKEISFSNVKLRYPAAEEFSVDCLNVTIAKGSTVAFVGSSGAGKSSVMDLLLRLYDPTSGQLCVDGQNLQKIDIGSWRAALGVVSQDSFIFNETIEENIRFGHLEASFEEIVQAAQLAGVHSLISSFPHGYHTLLGERGYRLSGGERQRIALARALVRNPEVLILDEATSSLDSQSERFIQEALERFHGQKTIIIVAHRLSTIVNADRIIVMEKGQLAESGTHEELLSRKGQYAAFWQLQALPVAQQEQEVLS